MGSLLPYQRHLHMKLGPLPANFSFEDGAREFFASVHEPRENLVDVAGDEAEPFALVHDFDGPSVVQVARVADELHVGGELDAVQNVIDADDVAGSRHHDVFAERDGGWEGHVRVQALARLVRGAQQQACGLLCDGKVTHRFPP